MANATVKSQTLTFDMVITPISKLNKVCSPEVTIYGFPRKVVASKHEEENSLSVYVRCGKIDKTLTWTAPASATVTLICHNKEKNALERHVPPYAFNTTSLSFGYTSFIQWNELLKDENKYVQDDTIEVKIEITAQNPSYVDRSILKFESIDMSCNCGSLVIYRLIVENVKHLMAVRSPQFMVRGLPYDLMVYKHQATELGIMLHPIESPKNVACNMKMSVKLLSSKNDVNVIKKSSTGKVQWPGNLMMTDMISWNELLKPENGYVNNDSITLEVKIKTDKPVGDAPNLDANIAAKRGRFECSICLEDIDKQDVSATPCCHLFCTACITSAVRKSRFCPVCKEPVQLNDLRRMYLSA